ncbi:hypothetical protein NSA47_02820 [Irregularibacter muris]|uniref:Uncharacterized protein n=1 Tax=Irregularibacter muris TaxID=1796619 RepID=A0AAE3HF58_9FIRM|nr:hypothetical protein [Irregularibacter muris]MCR1897919.1 hypothetical protein [Irregularibacter muris]
MAKHEFGIMQRKPFFHDRFDTYNPPKYNCIEIHDVFIEEVMMDLLDMDCYWHTLQRPEKGLAYYGITLIPPKSMEDFISILLSKNKEEYTALIALANQAKEKRKYIIHYGI